MDYNFKGIFTLLLISAIDMQLPHKYCVTLFPHISSTFSLAF